MQFAQGGDDPGGPCQSQGRAARALAFDIVPTCAKLACAMLSSANLQAELYRCMGMYWIVTVEKPTARSTCALTSATCALMHRARSVLESASRVPSSRWKPPRSSAASSEAHS